MPELALTPIVIIGGGHAAAQLCASLAEAGLAAQTQLVSDEPHLPYHRPPLSKAFLKSPTEGLMPHRPESWYREQGIALHLDDGATAIDRASKTVQLRSGARLNYGHLVLATGARARALPGLPAGLANAAEVRNAADATRLRALLGAAERVLVLGGGFIGLEVAATARALGKAVTVVELAPRLLARSVSPELAAHVLQVHRGNGIDIRLSCTAGLVIDGDRVMAATVGDERIAVDLLVPGIGAQPDTRLAEAAGLVCADGIVVDAQMRSSDAAILAVGDCTRFPAHALAAGADSFRLESVQNAADQARVAAATIAGRVAGYSALPWFWSEQAPMRLQMAGLMPAGGTRHRRPGASEASFSILHYDANDRLVCVESVNAPLDHVAARKLLELRRSVAPSIACDPAVALKTHIG
jgi:3-phenylpropionate/trans-cinnamate dioxygenase ferredoxin reductase subunit